MTFDETLEYLYSKLPMYQRIGTKAFKKDLSNIKSLCAALDNPHLDYKTIHVAGTNGKGSVTHLIAAALQAHGYKVGIYTSPHYRDFRERIKINGQLMAKDEVVHFVEQHRDLITEVMPSFFEITVAMAFAYFSQEEVDIAVIETGLGGIYDSTNIVEPIASVISNISYDHQNILGDTLPIIAQSKAGIIKPHTPVIIGEYQEEVYLVFVDKAEATQSELEVASNAVHLSESGAVSIYDSLWFDGLEIDRDNPFLTTNIKTAVMALYVLREPLNLNTEKIKHGLENFATMTYYIGRMQQLGSDPLIIADSAHNVAGMQLLMQYIEGKSYVNLHIVFGCVKDKDHDAVLSLFPESATYYFCKANMPRGMDASDLQEKAVQHGLRGSTFATVREAYDAACANAHTSDMVVVCGSIFVVAEIL